MIYGKNKDAISCYICIAFLRKTTSDCSMLMILMFAMSVGKRRYERKSEKEKKERERGRIEWRKYNDGIFS